MTVNITAEVPLLNKTGTSIMASATTATTTATYHKN
jgi:hypothetical protein